MVKRSQCGNAISQTCLVLNIKTLHLTGLAVPKQHLCTFFRFYCSLIRLLHLKMAVFKCSCGPLPFIVTKNLPGCAGVTFQAEPPMGALG